MGTKKSGPPSVEASLAAWASQAPGLRVSPAECEFIAAMRRAAAFGVGYGWMRQIIGVEWRHVDPVGGIDDDVVAELATRRRKRGAR